VGVGSNQDDPRRQVERALEALATLGVVRASSLYRGEPLGDPAQPWYVNAVAELRTDLSPRELLEALHRLERSAGRPAERARWSPRVLDLDLLLYDALAIDEPGLVVPHPGLAQRRFVLVPLAEIAPEAVDPRSGRCARELLAALDDPLALEKLPGREGPR
jgi:2-amino-4-hydroxy-6-hydroxymethyldihydropteridine diphosphokinase